MEAGAENGAVESGAAAEDQGTERAGEMDLTGAEDDAVAAGGDDDEAAPVVDAVGDA